MASDLPQSLVKGTTPATRALFFNMLTQNGIPTTPAQGIPTGMSANVDVLVAESAGGTFSAEVWWWYDVPEKWIRDSSIGSVTIPANGDAGAVTVPSAASLVYIRCFDPANDVAGQPFAGNAAASGWAIGRGVLGKT